MNDRAHPGTRSLEALEGAVRRIMSSAVELEIPSVAAVLDLEAVREADVVCPALHGGDGEDGHLQALLDLQAWMRSIASPAPGGYDEAAAERGFLLFNGSANCSSCHRSAEFTGPDNNIITATRTAWFIARD